jgi:hypothetical protein
MNLSVMSSTRTNSDTLSSGDLSTTTDSNGYYSLRNRCGSSPDAWVQTSPTNETGEPIFWEAN